MMFAKACELFIMELTLRSWDAADDDVKRKTLQRSDVAAAVRKTEVFDFMEDVVQGPAKKPALAASAVRPRVR